VSRRQKLSRAAITQAAVAVLLIAAVAWLLAHLARTPPTAELGESLPGLADPHIHLACDDPMPPPRPQRDDADTIEPVGRAISGEVMACPRQFDGHVVEYVGEVVGDVLRRRGGAWMLVNDDAYALEAGPLGLHRRPRGTNTGLAVWLPDPMPGLVGSPGRSGVRGDVIRVVGVLHRTDPEDGGGLTIRATTAELVAPAERAPEPFDREQALFALLLMALAVGVTVRERSRRLR
jgi:hypothetical protein